MDDAHRIDYEAVLADLILRRDALDAGIAAVRKIIASGITQSKPIAHQGNGSVHRQPADFSELTIVDGAILYLRSINKPQTVKEIAEALRLGGYGFKTSNPDNTVGAILHRAATKKRGIEKIGKNLYRIKY
jgi:hypothetical protein